MHKRKAVEQVITGLPNVISRPDAVENIQQGRIQPTGKEGKGMNR
jgi:hypothetical protein